MIWGAVKFLEQLNIYLEFVRLFAFLSIKNQCYVCLCVVLISGHMGDCC